MISVESVTYKINNNNKKVDFSPLLNSTFT